MFWERIKSYWWPSPPPNPIVAISQQLAVLANGQAAILNIANQILLQGKTIMATLADVQNDVTNEDTVVDSAVALLQGLAAQVAALQPNQAAIDALAADINAKTQVLANAVAANTPASGS